MVYALPSQPRYGYLSDAPVFGEFVSEVLQLGTNSRLTFAAF